MSVSRTRVLMVTTSTGVAGAERIVHGLALALGVSRRDCYEIEVAYLTGEPSEFDRDLEARGLVVTRLQGRRRRPFELLRRLRELVWARRPALVHSHLHHANVAMARVLRAAPEVPLIQTVHIIERRFRPLRPLLERRAVVRAAKVVAVSDAVAEHLGEIGWPRDRLCTIRNGIDLTPFAGTWQAPPDQPVVTFVGRLDAQKGVDVLLESFVSVVGRLPAARLRVAGDGPAASALHRRAERLGIADRVEWLGWRGDIAEVLSAATVVAFPSRFEGFGLVLAEAGAAARPVVAFDLPPTREIVVDGQTGTIVRRGDPSALADAIVDLLADPAEARRLGTLARQKVSLEFDVRRMIREYAVLYQSVLGVPPN